jgi:hypothetical protein
MRGDPKSRNKCLQEARRPGIVGVERPQIPVATFLPASRAPGPLFAQLIVRTAARMGSQQALAYGTGDASSTITTRRGYVCARRTVPRGPSDQRERVGITTRRVPTSGSI